MERVSIKHVNNLHNDWLRSLDFYKQELNIMKGRLTEVAGKNTDKDAMASVEQFENQIKLKNENADILVHSIKKNLSQIATQAEHSSAGYIDTALLNSHTNLGERVNEEEKKINELRHTFNSFAAKWM